MNTQARILNRVTQYMARVDERATMRDFEDLAALKERIPGWSQSVHQLFFRAVFAEPSIKRVLCCGVYHGLDLAIMQALLDRHHPGRDVQLVGVDLFSSEPCADWPEAKRGMTWEQAFGCRPPSMEAARRNCPKATIIACPSQAYLETCAGDFDFIWLDTSHDETTVRKELHFAGCPLVLAGDDYSGPPEWGVDRAVSVFWPNHAVLFDRIWVNAPTP